MQTADWISIGTTCVMLGSALFVAGQAFYTRRLVNATTSAYLDGRILLSVVPYGSNGAVNLRLENVGAGAVDAVNLLFPGGLVGAGDHGPIDLSGVIPQEIGPMGPREKREWFLGFTGGTHWRGIPKSVPYELRYSIRSHPGSRSLRRAKCRVVTHSGALHLDTYHGSLLRAFTSLEDLRLELQALRAELKKLADRLEGP